MQLCPAAQETPLVGYFTGTCVQNGNLCLPPSEESIPTLSKNDHQIHSVQAELHSHLAPQPTSSCTLKSFPSPVLPLTHLFVPLQCFLLNAI